MENLEARVKPAGSCLMTWWHNCAEAPPTQPLLAPDWSSKGRILINYSCNVSQYVVWNKLSYPHVWAGLIMSVSRKIQQVYFYCNDLCTNRIILVFNSVRRRIKMLPYNLFSAILVPSETETLYSEAVIHGVRVTDEISNNTLICHIFPTSHWYELEKWCCLTNIPLE